MRPTGARGCPSSLEPVELADLIRTRRTHKAYAPGPIDRETLDELFELARWAPTLVAASVVQDGDPVAAEEDFAAAACAVYIVLLAAHDRGLGGYWRTPAVLRTAEGRAACGIGENERVLGLIHLGEARGEKPAPERAPLAAVVEHLP